MAYEFPPRSANGNERSLTSDLVTLTRSNKSDPTSGFCRGLQGRFTAYDFDEIKNDFCRVRGQRCYGGARLKSTDALFVSADGTFYFIEFKKSSREKLDAIDEDGYKIPFDVSLKRKAVDSLAVSVLTVLQDKAGAEVCNNAVLFVVYRQSAMDTLGVLAINSGLTALSGGRDSIYATHPIMWSLDGLKKLGLYKDVHTWPEDRFVDWAAKTLQ